MRSRISSCNRVLRKDLTRFAPVWVEYTVFLLLLLYTIIEDSADITANRGSFLGAFAFINAIYGFVVAVSLFGYLTDPKECSTVHAFPIRREEYFVVHITAGLLMALVPNALFCLANIPLDLDGSLLVFFAGMMLEYICFFGMAVFSMFLTGRKIGAATVYALLNWMALLILWAVETIYLPLLPGVELNAEDFYRFCPVVRMYLGGGNHFRMPMDGQMLTDLMPTLGAYALVGVALSAVSMLLYRRRKLEYAGDFIAVKALTPVFLFALSFACGCVLAAFNEIAFGDSYWIVLTIGLVVGYFTGLMLMKRTVKVFRPKALLGGAAVIAIVFASIFVTWLDPLGRVGYVPETDEIAMVEVAPSASYFDNGSYSSLHTYSTENPAVIADLRDIHSDLVESDWENSESGYCVYYIRYTLKSGSTVSRFYYSDDLELEKRANFYFSQPEAILGVSSMEELRENCKMVELIDYANDYVNVDITGEDKEALMEVFFRECREGRMIGSGQGFVETAQRDISVIFAMEEEGGYSSFEVPDTAVDTLALCEELVDKYQNAAGELG